MICAADVQLQTVRGLSHHLGEWGEFEFSVTVQHRMLHSYCERETRDILTKALIIQQSLFYFSRSRVGLD